MSVSVAAGEKGETFPSVYSLVQPLLLAVASVTRQEGEVEEAAPQHRLGVEEEAVEEEEACSLRKTEFWLRGRFKGSMEVDGCGMVACDARHQRGVKEGGFRSC